MTNGTRVVAPNEVDIGGCRCLSQKVFEDMRGSLVVDLQEQSTQDVLQVYHSWTLRGHARDANTWHLHHEQMDRFFVIVGRVSFALSNGVHIQMVNIDGQLAPYQLIVPPGVYHCYKNYGPWNSCVMNVPDRLYNPDDELRIPFTELGVGSPW